MNIPEPICHKLAYSKRLLTNLDSEIEWYLNEKSDDVIRDQYKDPSSFARIIEGSREVPILIRLMCGDVLQNIRSTLDYLVWELVIANKDQPDESNALPVCKSPTSFKEASKKRLRGIDPEAVTLIESLQPYHFGQGKENESFLFVLDKLANFQKHRTILIARERHAPAEVIRFVDTSGKVWLDPLRVPDANATAQFMRNAFEANMNVQMTVFVQFGQGPAQGLEVMSVVSGLYQNVALDVIPQFNRFFG